MSRLELPPETLQPSQLYISRSKLDRVRAWFDPERRSVFEPVPVKRLDDALVLTDGHTRALVAHLAGWQTVPAVWDTDDLDWEAYRVCVQWCRAEGIRAVGDLAARIVSEKDYQRLWLNRCRRLHQELIR